MSKKWLIGSTIFAIFLIIQGFIGLLVVSGYFWVLTNPTSDFSIRFYESMERTQWGELYRRFLPPWGVWTVNFFEAIGAISCAIGIFVRKEWARKLVLLLVCLDLAETVLDKIIVGESGSLLFVVFELMALFYFTRQKVKAHFK